MPLNESTGKPPRERWPAQFDIEGIPRDNATRERLLEDLRNSETEKRTEMAQFKESADRVNVSPVPPNHFAVDDKQFANEPFITDINNPPQKRYKHQEYPKILYGHEGAHAGRVITIQPGPNAEKEEAAAKKKGFKEEPSPNHDYSRIRSGRAAEQTAAPPDRELTAEQLAKLDEEDPE